MTELCIRCGKLPAEHCWPHCEECYQDVCNEAHAAMLEEADAPLDDISRLMVAEGLGFIEAVLRLAKERRQ